MSNQNIHNNKNNTNQIIEAGKKHLVLLYCPSKVGSTSIVSSIRLSASDKFFVFHTHDKIVSNVKFSNGDNKSITVSDIIKNASNERKVYIIDVYRPTIEKRISTFFQDLSEKHFNNYEENINNYDIKKIIKRFNDIFPYIKHIDYYKDMYNLPDIEKDKPFDIEKKYMSYEMDNVTYVKLRLLDSNNWDDMLSDILSTQIFLLHDYKSENKKIGFLYKKFIDDYKLPYNFFRMMELCPQLKYYYSEQERETYLDKWRGKITDCYTHFNQMEYNIYEKISEENRILFKNLNLHYFDDGCQCVQCINKRNNLLEQLKLNKGIVTDINLHHPFDDYYSCYITLKLFSNENDKTGTLCTTNVINY